MGWMVGGGARLGCKALALAFNFVAFITVAMLSDYLMGLLANIPGLAYLAIEGGASLLLLVIVGIEVFVALLKACVMSVPGLVKAFMHRPRRLIHVTLFALSKFHFQPTPRPALADNGDKEKEAFEWLVPLLLCMHFR